MNKIDVYMSLSQKGLINTKDDARKTALSVYGTKDAKDILLYEDCELKVDEISTDDSDETIEVGGELFHKGINLGYISLSIPFKDISLDIINNYIDKLESVKKVMSVIK